MEWGTPAVFTGAIAATALAFGLFAWTFLNALNDGAEAYSSTMGKETSRAFEDMFLFIPPAKIARLGRIGAIAAFFLCFIPFFSFTSAVSTLSGTALGLAAGLLAFSLPGRYASILRQRRRIKFNEQLVEALATMSNALRAGFSISQAFESVIESGERPIAQEFSVVTQQLRVGMSFEDALASMDERVGSEDLTLVVTAIDIARKTGGNLTEIFDRISDTIRSRMRIERRVRTLTAQGRMQGMVVSLMPIVLGGILTLMKPGLMLPFLLSLKGAIAVGIALALVGAGWLMIRRIVRIDV